MGHHRRCNAFQAADSLRWLSHTAYRTKELSLTHPDKGFGRDERQYPDPDRFDVEREIGRHVSFGYGTHFCLGASLARLEARSAITALIRRFPRLELAGEPTWRDRLTIRGVDHLPLTLR